MFTIAFSKRFTSNVSEWTCPQAYTIDSSSPGRVEGFECWTRLDMNREEALAVLEYAKRHCGMCDVSLFDEDGNPIGPGRKADDMVAAKGFATSAARFVDGTNKYRFSTRSYVLGRSREGMKFAEGDSVPFLTVEDIRKEFGDII